MTREAIQRALERALAHHDEQQVLEALEKLAVETSDVVADTLTIVANQGMHHLPDYLRRGEVYVASEGSLDFGSEESVARELTVVLERLAGKLKERAWKKVYLVPFGPTNLSILIKLLVYRVTHIETVDVFHAGSGSYFEVDIPLRPIVTSAK